MHLFFSHVHWDHIQGFPFFAPAFAKGTTIHMYGSGNVTGTVETALAGQMEMPNFPVLLAHMPARLQFHDLLEGQWRLRPGTVRDGQAEEEDQGDWAHAFGLAGSPPSVAAAPDRPQGGTPGIPHPSRIPWTYMQAVRNGTATAVDAATALVLPVAAARPTLVAPMMEISAWMPCCCRVSSSGS